MMSSTFSIRTEARRQLRRRRSQIALGITVLLPALLLLALQFGDHGGDQGGGEGAYANVAPFATTGAINFALFTLSATSFLLLVLVALLFGDTVASEASWGSLRYLLAASVARSRLLASKGAVSATSSLGLMALLVGLSLGLGVVAYGWHPLQLSGSITLSTGTALARLAGIAAYMALGFLPVAGLAFLLSVSIDSPIGAVGGAVMFQIVTQIFSLITALGRLREALPTYHDEAWLGLLATPVETGGMTKGALVAVIYSAVFFGAAWWRFTTKDITS